MKNHFKFLTMRKIISYIYIIGVTLLMAACSSIDENERFIYVKPADVARCVLLEDYTGQMCVNCPKAVDVINQIHEAYGDNVIAVGVHGGRLSLPSSSSPLGLATDEGNEYFNAAGHPNQPSGRVNRLGTPSNIDFWPSLVAEEIAKIAPLSIELATSYDEATSTVTVDVKTMGTNGNTTGKLQLWLVEDNIVAPQFMPDGSRNLEYVHNHVLRGAVNGTWGEDFCVNEGEEKTVTRTATLKDHWKAEDMSVVAFVYNDNGVQQAAKIKISVK